MLKLILPNSIRSKKNSKRIFARGKMKIVLPSKAYLEWEDNARREAAYQLSSDFKIITEEISVKALIYYKGVRPDLSGCLESIGDCLEKLVYENDKLISSWDGSRLIHDKKNPRTELIIKLYEE